MQNQHTDFDAFLAVTVSSDPQPLDVDRSYSPFCLMSLIMKEECVLCMLCTPRRLQASLSKCTLFGGR